MNRACCFGTFVHKDHQEQSSNFTHFRFRLTQTSCILTKKEPRELELLSQDSGACVWLSPFDCGSFEIITGDLPLSFDENTRQNVLCDVFCAQNFLLVLKMMSRGLSSHLLPPLQISPLHKPVPHGNVL